MFEVIKLDSTEERKKYSELISSQKKNNPYLLLDFMQAFSGGLDNLICFKYTNEKTIILMPGYLRKVVIGKNTTQYFDFITPYGYTGPYFNRNTSNEDIDNFWNSVDKWYLENSVVSEFIRFNLDGNDRNYNGSIIPTMLNIKGKIIDSEEQWRNFEHKVRKNVKKAKRENLSCRVFHMNDMSQEEIQNFYDIYIHTMHRTNADEKFFFSFENVSMFINRNPENSAICNIYHKDRIVSSELILISNDCIFSFLGGTDENYFDKRPNDFLKFEMINWARENNIKYYVLGGGYGYEDGIYKYKKSFFPNDIVKYCTGRKIVNTEAYNELFEMNNSYRREKGLETLNFDDTSFFPLYNKKVD